MEELLLLEGESDALALAEGLIEAEGEREAEGEILALTEDDGETDEEGLTEAEGEIEAEAEEISAAISAAQPRPYPAENDQSTVESFPSRNCA